MNNDDLQSVEQQETNWTGSVYQWLGDYIDEDHQKEFNNSPLNSGMAMPGTHPLQLAAIWKRTKGRMDTLTRFRAELTAISER